ncbi:MAG: AMIN domain-containing protein [Chloroflexi bacterium]|nr:AMIN domain-containing protein [Chloroflexota bacterium]
MLAVGLYGCPPGGLIQDEQGPATTPPAMVAQTQTPTEEKPVRSLESIEEATLEDVFKLQDLVVREGRGQTTVTIKFSEPVTQYRHFTLTQPTRIVLDVFGDVKRRAELKDFRIDTSWVNSLRISSSEGYLRVVAEITAVPAPAYVIEPESDGLKMIIGTINPDATAKKDLQLVKGGKRVDVKVAEAKPSAPEAPEAMPQAFPPQAEPVKEKEYTGQRISLDFKDADIKNVFRLLAEISDLNIVITDDVEQFTGLLNVAALMGSTTPGPDAGDRTLAAAAFETLCFSVVLPDSAANSLQSLSTVTTFTFESEQTLNNP